MGRGWSTLQADPRLTTKPFDIDGDEKEVMMIHLNLNLNQHFLKKVSWGSM